MAHALAEEPASSPRPRPPHAAEVDRPRRRVVPAASRVVTTTGRVRGRPAAAGRLSGWPARSRDDPAEAVRHLAAIQAQDLPGRADLAGALRTAGRSREAVLAACDAGRDRPVSWPMRGTLHVLPAEDLGWMLPARHAPPARAGRPAPRPARAPPTPTSTGPSELARRAVPATRAGLFAVWEEAGLAPARGAATTCSPSWPRPGVLCFGPIDDGEPAIVAVDDWIPRPGRLERDEALGEWARRYFRSHGPASVTDFARWTGVPAADVRTAVALARPDLTTMDVDGTEHLLDPAVPDLLAAHRRAARGVHLLPPSTSSSWATAAATTSSTRSFATASSPAATASSARRSSSGAGWWAPGVTRGRLEVDRLRPLRCRPPRRPRRQALARLPA